MKDKLITLANQLSDLAGEYEEKVTQRSWVNDGWKQVLQALREHNPDTFDYPDDTDPTEVVHSLLMRLQDYEQPYKKQEKKRYQLDWDEVMGGNRNFLVNNLELDRQMIQQRLNMDAERLVNVRQAEPAVIDELDGDEPDRL